MIIDDAVGEPKTLQFSLKAQELRRQGRDIISLGLGEPDYDTPEHIKQAAVDALRAGMTRYSATPGLPELRECVAHKLQQDNGVSASPAEVVITPGAKNALFIACAAVLRPGDEVLNLTPCYVSNVPILKLAEPQSVVRNIPLLSGSFRVDRDRILAAVTGRTRLLVTNYPNNPCGKMLDEDDAAFLRDLVRTRGLFWLSDEIYERLALEGRRHVSPASFEDVRERVITVNGFSKSYSMTGWRIGYTHAPSSLTAVMLRIHQQLNTNTAAFIQMAALAALTGPQDRLAQFVRDLTARAVLCAGLCGAEPILPATRVEGGFFSFADIRSSGLGSDAFAARLLEETGVAVIPGVSFGEDFDGWVRVSLAAPAERLAEGLSRLRGFVERRAEETG